MNSVDELVRTTILTHPSMFSDRTTVLHHVLCVIGNGFEWTSKGTIVANSSHPFPLWSKEEKLAELEAEKTIKYASKIIKVMALADLRRELKQCTKVVEQIDARVHKHSEIKDFYPQSNYALIMNIPANVTEDWKDACEGMKELAQKAGWSF